MAVGRVLWRAQGSTLSSPSLGALTLGPRLLPTERLVGSTGRVHQQDTPQLRGHSSVAIIIVTITTIICRAQRTVMGTEEPRCPALLAPPPSMGTATGVS